MQDYWRNFKSITHGYKNSYLSVLNRCHRVFSFCYLLVLNVCIIWQLRSDSSISNDTKLEQLMETHGFHSPIYVW